MAGTVAVSGCSATGAGAPSSGASATPTGAGGDHLVPFRGARQAGVTTEPQPFGAWVGLDLSPGADRGSLQRLLRVLTDDIERLMAAEAPVTSLEPELAAVPSRLSVTVGVGPGCYRAGGLESRRPEWLTPLPAFSIDRLEERWGQTDLVLQVCADSPVAVAHTVRRLVVGARPLVRQRWVQRGFREPLTQVQRGLPFRNLFGQVDGTVQPDVAGSEEGLVWIGAGGPPGLVGGTSMVLRRIQMGMEGWDRVDRAGREHAIGRRLDTGAPLTGRSEHDAPDLRATDELGLPVIDPVSHMRRAMPVAAHERILRRPYSFDDPPEAGQTSNSGLLFVSFQADPVRQFVPIQRRLAEADVLNVWTVPVGSAVYAVLPGARPGESLGAALFADT